MKDEIEARIKMYEKKLKAGELKFKIAFFMLISEMPMSKLRTEFIGNINDYCVQVLNVSKVLDQMPSKNGMFPVGGLKIDDSTVNLLELIENGCKIIPPQIGYIKNGDSVLYDGQHRIGLIRYLNMKTAPFLVKKADLSHWENFK